MRDWGPSTGRLMLQQEVSCSKASEFTCAHFVTHVLVIDLLMMQDVNQDVDRCFVGDLCACCPEVCLKFVWSVEVRMSMCTVWKHVS